MLDKNDIACYQNKYLDCIVQLKYVIKAEDFRRNLCINALEVFFKQNVLLNEDPRIVNYYLKTFLKFVESNLSYIEEDEWNIIWDKIQSKLIPIMTWADETYSDRVFILFEVLGIFWDNQNRLIESRIDNINKCIAFIIEMFNHASNLFQIKLCRKCTLIFLSRFGSHTEPEICKLFIFAQELFVQRIFPGYQADMINSDKIWDWNIDYSNKNEKECMLELRKLILLIYQDLYRKFDQQSKIELIKISFPVIISCIYQDFDLISGEEPSYDSILSLLQWLLISLDWTDTDVMMLFERILFRLLEIINAFFNKVKLQDKRSTYALEFAGIWDHFFKIIIKVIYIDSHILLIRNQDTVFVIEFIDFMKQVIDNPVSPRWTEQAVQITLNLNKEYTTYKDEGDIAKKKEAMGIYIDKTLPSGNISKIANIDHSLEEFSDVLGELREFSRYLIKDFIYWIDPQQGKNRGKIY